MTIKTVLITGASSGIGTACAEAFAKSGAKILLCARRLDKLEVLAKKLQTNVHFFQCDVCDHSDIKAKLQALPDEWKHIDILVNNAGLAAGMNTIQEGDTKDWEAMIDTNIKGLLYMTREIVPSMIERKSGHIINLGSIASHQVYQKGAVYCATKYAVDALSQGMRMDLLGTHIRVSQISPGAVETEFSIVRFKGDVERAKAFYKGFTPLCAEDIASAVLYAASCPPHVNISEIVIMPTAQAAVGMIAKN